MRLLLAVLIGKIIAKITRFLKLGGGSAAPGLYALKIESKLVEKLIQKIPKNIIITGTNGKTTTARMLAHLAKEAGLKVIRNHTGSNLERGIASALISHPRGVICPACRQAGSHLGIWELDEAAFNNVAPKINPDIVIFLNVSRDQLDRYGEVDKVVNDWCQTLAKLDPKTTVLINADEPDLAKLQDYFKGKIVEFGKKNLKNIKLNGLKGSQFTIYNVQFTINLPGMYHIYNALAAIICAYHLNIPVKSLTKFSPAFGRFEKFSLQPSRLHRKNGYIFLIKNPAGATQVFQTLAPLIKKQDRLLIALNDNLADGTDVSWIWDAEFERLPLNMVRGRQVTGYRLQIICSGSRAYDLAVRLKYAGFDSDSIGIEPDLKKALEASRKGLRGQLFILPTYTAMLEIQRILAKQGHKKHYWEEK